MLEIKDLCKNYKRFNALNNLNLEVETGEIFGFVGPNGAGKTTTMKILCGLLPPTSGDVFIDEVDVIRNSKKARERIGYMPDFFGVYDDLKVIEYLHFYGSIYNIRGRERDKICDELLELVNLTDKKHDYVDGLSRGMKQRLCLARCLVHNPSLLVLDEPASGMDPKSRSEMKDILRALKDMGKTIIISSHILIELAELCTSIGIIDRGKIVISGTVEEITNKIYSARGIKIKVHERAEEAIMLLKEFTSINKITQAENIIQASYEGEEEGLKDVLKRLVSMDIPVISFSQLEGNLEDIFMKVIGGGENEAKN